MTKRFQVVGIGNALVDILCHVDDAFLEEIDVIKGVMQLVDRGRASAIYERMGPAREISGGSAANTIAGIAALGGRTAYVGKVRDDQFGRIFAHDLRAQGAVYETPAAPADTAEETGRCMVLVTPDGERTMNTYLGVSEHLCPGDIDEAMMADAEWIYLEGYRFDGPENHEAFDKAIRAAKGAGGKVSLTLSDPFCVDRHRAAFLAMIRRDVDLLFCNRDEILSLYETDSLDEALARGGQDVGILVVTDSDKGAYVIEDGAFTHVPTRPARVVDATGAGDLFAAGFLWGFTHGHDSATAARMGNIAAAEIIGHIGARPEVDLARLFSEAGLI